MNNLRFAGVHWGTNHTPPERAWGLLDGRPTIMCDPECKWHYLRASQEHPDSLVIWRGMPPRGKRPNETDAATYANAMLDVVRWVRDENGLTDKSFVKDFTFGNEMELDYEAGGQFRGFGWAAGFYDEVISALSAEKLTARLWWPAWTPDKGDLDNLRLWIGVAGRCFGILVHAYGDPDTIVRRLRAYRQAFPSKPLILAEWNPADRSGDPQADIDVLRALRDYQAENPLFLGACRYTWKWGRPADGWTDRFDIEGRANLEAIYADPERALGGVAPPPPIPVPVPGPVPPQPMPVPPQPPPEGPMTEYEQFCRAEAAKRGIDPDTAVIVANSEGSLTEPARRGTFDTGSSWWAFQLHYGGPEYPQYGTVAGMGVDFTRLTGWAPGDPAAWKDAMRYALDWARVGGWGKWYGAKAKGITGFDGIDRAVAWKTPDSEWDYRQGQPPGALTLAPSFDPSTPLDQQTKSWECAEQSLLFALHSIGRGTGDAWLENELLVRGIESTGEGLTDHTGDGLAAFIRDVYQYQADNLGDVVTFDQVAALAGRKPILLGGRAWGHWTGVRSYGAADDCLILANPATNWKGVGDQLDRTEWATWGPWSAMWIEVAGVPAGLAALPVPVPTPDPGPPPENDELAGLRSAVGYLCVDLLERRLSAVQTDLAAQLIELQAVRTEADRVRRQYLEEPVSSRRAQ